MKALVTGFEPFGCERVNASLEAARRLPPRLGSLEIATAVRPERAWGWYRLAQQRALATDRRGALDALRRAVAAGFDDESQLASDEAFAALRDEAKFRELVARLAAGTRG